MMARLKASHFNGWDRSSFVCCLALLKLLLLQISVGVVWHVDLQLSCNTLYLLSHRLCFFIVLNGDLFVNRDDSLTSERVIMRTEQGSGGPVKLI